MNPFLVHPVLLRAQKTAIPDRMLPLVAELSEQEWARNLTIDFNKKPTGEFQMILGTTVQVQIDDEFYSDAVVVETTDDTGVLLVYYSNLFNEVSAVRRCEYGDVVKWIELYAYKLQEVTAGAYRNYCVDGVMKSPYGNVLPVPGGLVFTWEGSEAFKKRR